MNFMTKRIHWLLSVALSITCAIMALYVMATI